MPPLLTLQSEQLRVTLAPQAGGSVVACAFRLGSEWLPVLRPTPPEAVAQGNSSQMASFILAPWSNRIRAARFQFYGQAIALQPNTPEGHAIHGDVRRRPWQVDWAHESQALLSFDSAAFPDINFPFPFRLAARYSVQGAAFDSELTLTNTGAQPMPAGLGFHPYFQRALRPGEDVELQFRGTGAYQGLVPEEAAGPLQPEQDFSRRRAVGGQAFDDCFAGWDGRAEIHWPRTGVTARFACSPALGHLILFAPTGKPFFALEPVTHANNGFNLFAGGAPGTGVQALAPGEALRARWQLQFASG
jgi:aldose 1-epimerase